MYLLQQKTANAINIPTTATLTQAAIIATVGGSSFLGSRKITNNTRIERLDETKTGTAKLSNAFSATGLIFNNYSPKARRLSIITETEINNCFSIIT